MSNNFLSNPFPVIFATLFCIFCPVLSQALLKFEQSLKLYQTQNNKLGQANCFTNIGIIYSILGESQKALDYFNQALPIYKTVAVRDRNAEASVLNDIGIVYNRLGESQKALDYYNKALPIYKAVGDLRGEARALGNIGNVYINLGELQKALDYHNQALPIYKTIGDRNDEATGLNNIGNIYSILGESQKALDYYNQAFPIYKAVGDRNGEARALNNMGRNYDSLGERQKALDYYNQALPIYKAVGNRSGEAFSLYNLALSHYLQKNLEQALSDINSAIAIVEDLRIKIINKDLRTSYFATVQDYYQLKIKLLMELDYKYPKQGYNIQALETSESARARSLLELLQEAKANIKQGADPQILKSEKEIILELDEFEKLRIETLSKNQALPASLTEKIDQLKQQYQEIQTQIRKSSPRYASLTQPQPLKLAQIQQLLDPNSVILEYALANEKSYLFMITKDNFSSYQIDGQEKIEKLIQQYQRAIKMKVSLKQVASPLRDILLAPVLSQIGNKRLIIVADGSLQTIPFSTINNINNEPLLQTNELINLPSASTLAILRDNKSTTKKPSKTLAIFADPIFNPDDPRLTKVNKTNNNKANELTRAAAENSINFVRLTNTKTEAENISKLLPVNQEQLFIDFAANKVNISNSELANYRILHLATHGLFNTQDPSRSGLLLSRYNQQGEPENGQLLLEDIFNLNLSNSELVVLSACQTGIGQQIKGEGIVGISRGFMYAGSPRVVVSLWNVDDLATSILMSKFYQGLLQQGLTAAQSLRNAQLEMLKDPNYQAPYYWAPFILIGDWN